MRDIREASMPPQELGSPLVEGGVADAMLTAQLGETGVPTGFAENSQNLLSEKS